MMRHAEGVTVVTLTPLGCEIQRARARLRSYRIFALLHAFSSYESSDNMPSSSANSVGCGLLLTGSQTSFASPRAFKGLERPPTCCCKLLVKYGNPYEYHKYRQHPTYMSSPRVPVGSVLAQKDCVVPFKMCANRIVNRIHVESSCHDKIWLLSRNVFRVGFHASSIVAEHAALSAL